MLKVKTDRGRHYGVITAKNCDVLEALFGSFTVFRQGCAPYKSIAAKAQCSRSRVCAAALVPFEEAVRKEIRHRAFGFPKSEAA